MRISKEVSGNALARDVQTSQGRGEYEWCDLNANDPSFADLLNKRIVIRLPDGTLVDTGCILGQQGGKQRVRIAEGVQGRELYPPWHAAGLLMMPKPIRAEPSWGDGTPVMRNGQYGIMHLHLRSVAIDANNRAVVEIGQVEIANQYQQDSIDFAQRFEQVRQIWNNRGRFEPTTATLIEEHERLAHLGGLVSAQMIRTTSELQREIADRAIDYGIVGNAPTTDVVPSLLLIVGGIQREPDRDVGDVPPEEMQIRKREVKQWKQWAIARGSDSARFRKAVRQAYNATCVVCGLRFPPLGNDTNPGVDAAHILPWSNYDLDHVCNGLCLCKTHHWAFDEGFLEIIHEEGVYRIAVPDEARQRAAEFGEDFSIEFLLESQGVIPDGRLPRNVAERPNPAFLTELRRYMAGQ